MTRPRAADDFAVIRARMEELRRERAPRAADDFAAIRARMEELRRERAQMSAARDAGPLCPRPYSVGAAPYRQCGGDDSDRVVAAGFRRGGGRCLQEDRRRL